MSEFTPWTLNVLAWAATYAIHSTLLIGGVALLVRLRQSLSPTSRDLLWKIALLGPLATASLQLGLGIGGQSGQFALSSATEKNAPTRQAPPPMAPERATQPAPESGRQLVFADANSVMVLSLPARRSAPVTAFAGAVAQQASPPPRTTASPASAQFSPTIAALLVGLFGLGSTLALGLFVRRIYNLRRHLQDRRVAVEDPALELFLELTAEIDGGKSMRLSTSDAIRSPIALVRREICVPSRALEQGTIPPTELRAMLAHELAHLVRRDPEWLMATACLEALLFFQPLLRLLRRRMIDNAELLCDAWARERTGDGLALAKCIERVAAWIDQPGLPLASAMARPHSPVIDRIRRLVQPADRRQLTGSQGIGLGLAILGALAWLAPSVSSASIDSTDSTDSTDSPDSTSSSAESPVLANGNPEFASVFEICPSDSNRRAHSRCSTRQTHRLISAERGWTQVAFAPGNNHAFTAAMLASAAPSRGRAQRRAQREARHAGRAERRRSRQRQRLAADLHRAQETAHRSRTRTRRLEAEARRLGAEARRLETEAHHLEIQSRHRGPENRDAQVFHITTGPHQGGYAFQITNDDDTAQTIVVELDLDALGEIALADFAALANLADFSDLDDLAGLADLDDLDLDLVALNRGLRTATPGHSISAQELFGREFEQEIRRALENAPDIDDLTRRELKRELARIERELATVERHTDKRDRRSDKRKAKAKAKAKAK